MFENFVTYSLIDLIIFNLDTQWTSPPKERLAEKISSHSPSVLPSDFAYNQESAERNASPYLKRSELVQDLPCPKLTNDQLTSPFSEESETTKSGLSSTQPSKVQFLKELKSSTVVPCDHASKSIFAAKSAKQSKHAREVTCESPTKVSPTETIKLSHAKSHPNPSEGQTQSAKHSKQDTKVVFDLAFHKAQIDHSDMYLAPLNTEHHSRKSETLSVYPPKELSTKTNVGTFAKQSKAKTKVPPVEFPKVSFTTLPAKHRRKIYKSYGIPSASTESSTYTQDKSFLIAEPSVPQQIAPDKSPSTTNSFAEKSKESSTLSLVVVAANTSASTNAENSTEHIILSIVATSAIQTPPRRRFVPSYK